MLLFFTCASILLYFSVVVTSGSSFDFTTNSIYTTYNKNSVDIIEFNQSEFCLKNYDSEDYLVSGESLYIRNCVYCHTINKDGSLDLLPLQEVVDRIGQDRFKDVVKNGRGEMPVYGFVLSDEEIKIVTKYLEHIQKTSK